MINVLAVVVGVVIGAGVGYYLGNLRAALRLVQPGETYSHLGMHVTNEDPKEPCGWLEGNTQQRSTELDAVHTETEPQETS